MKFTLDWLKEHLETSATAGEIADALNMIGLEVESVTDRASRLGAFVVARVVTADPHPNADRLRVCRVDAGTGEIVDVVCGAPNAMAGMKSVFAFPGTYIPGKDAVLQKGVIRGAPSNGMLCSAMELELGEDHAGIIRLADDAPVGMRYVDYAGLGGAVFDISITPNRGDAAGVRGIARDLGAFGIGRFIDAPVPPQPSPAGASPIGVALRFDGAPVCRMFAGRLIRGVTNGPSPQWLQDRLRAVGLRPISALVDITNFVTLDRARPLHVFDADRLSGDVHARMARPGEELAALDGRTYALDEAMCVIADDSGALGIGGIIGGETTGCTDRTVNVFVESAWFEPESIAGTGRRLGIASDARYRFERTVDPQSVLPGIELATRLIVELCGGEAHEVVVAGHVAAPRTIVDFPLLEVRRLTGLDAPAGEIVGALERLGFEVTADGPIRQVVVPSWRPDVALKADLAEEAMRMLGVDRVPVTPLARAETVAPRMLSTIQNRRRLARRLLASRGLHEAITWSFIPAADARLFGGGSEALKLANPIAAELTDMRPSLIPGLLAALRRNRNRGFVDLALFEVGQIFLSPEPAGQHTHATGARAGTTGRTWRCGERDVDVFDTKADLGALLELFGYDLGTLQIGPPPAWAHPGRGGTVMLGPRTNLAGFGQVHPDVLAAFDLAGPVVVFELDIDALPEPRRRLTRSRPALRVSDLMPVVRDFAFVVDRDVAATAILRAARGADKALIADATIFDVFEGAHVGESKKSVGVAVTLQPRDRTLTDADIEQVSAAVVAAIGKATGAVLRQ